MVMPSLVGGIRRRTSPAFKGVSRRRSAFRVRHLAGPALRCTASLEKRHARRADLVITVSRYCAERLEELYGVRDAVVVPG